MNLLMNTMAVLSKKKGQIPQVPTYQQWAGYPDTPLLTTCTVKNDTVAGNAHWQGWSL